MSDSALAGTGGFDAAGVKILLKVLADVKGGDFSARLPFEWTGVAGRIADGVNDVIVANEGLGAELARVSRVVGEEGEREPQGAPGVSPSSVRRRLFRDLEAAERPAGRHAENQERDRRPEQRHLVWIPEHGLIVGGSKCACKPNRERVAQ